MTAPAIRRRVFLLSTIYDFADLRSSLKFWIEELGYVVDASECNDFQSVPFGSAATSNRAGVPPCANVT